jgi:micrococcal nuclease
LGVNFFESVAARAEFCFSSEVPFNFLRIGALCFKLRSNFPQSSSKICITKTLPNNTKAMFTPMILGLAIELYVIVTQIVSVSDGDTLTVRRNDNGRNMVIKLACIDAPERNQPWGKESAQRLSKLLPKGLTVSLGYFGDKDQNFGNKDPYGRTIGVVGNEVQSTINLQLVKEGQAWVYEKEIRRCRGFEQEFRQSQAAAQKQRLGLWSQTNPCPPWDYRSNKCGARRTPSPKKLRSNGDPSYSDVSIPPARPNRDKNSG